MCLKEVFPLNFFETFEKDRYWVIFEGLLGETIWFWTFAFWEIFDYYFNVLVYNWSSQFFFFIIKYMYHWDRIESTETQTIYNINYTL